MTIRVISEKPVETKKTVCKNCGYELEFCNVDLVPHRTDSDRDPIEPRGMYLVCPRGVCNHRNMIIPQPLRGGW